MKKRTFWAIFLFLVVLLINSCATAPSHPALQESDLPKLIPLRKLFVNVETAFGYKISPDGKKLGWIAVKNRKLTVHFKILGKEDITILDTHSPQNVFGFAWMPDSRKLLFWQDREGNENYHIFLADIEHPKQKPVDLTPFENTRAGIHRIIREDPENILVSHNQRDQKYFDLYRININTGRQTLIAENPGDILSWITGDDGALRARIRKNSSGNRFLELNEPDTKIWKIILTWGWESFVRFQSFTADNRGMWILSNIDRDKTALVKLNLDTGEETVVYEDPRVDLGWVLISYKSKQPLIAASFPDYQKLHFFDPNIRSESPPFMKQHPSGIAVMSSDYHERLVTLVVYTDKSADHYLYNRKTREMERLSSNPISAYADRLSTVKPIAFKSRDGLQLHGYLTLPKGSSGRNLPLVLLVHGGPWARDYWGYRDINQFLANRGYAVLQVNYRGSTGYGRDFKEAAIGEFAGKMHTDLVDGVNWAIAKGIADPEKIGIFGFSYGGYATLVGMTFTPDIFACGVDVFGISNLVSFSKTVPRYWKIWMPHWHKYLGNPDKPEDRKVMEAKSPLFKVDRIKRPLLIVQGANDPRVNQQESEQMVSALKNAGKEVEYILFPDEGHSIRKWQNRLVFFRTLEDFLAKHLGGRSAGFDFYELGLLLF